MREWPDNIISPETVESTDIRIAELRTGHLGTAMGVATASPSVSWRLEGDAPFDGARPAAYEIRATWSNGDTETTGRVESDRVSYRAWPFRPLMSRERVGVAVRSWLEGPAGEELRTPWSEGLDVEATLLRPEDWVASKVGPPRSIEQGRESAVFRFRREFDAEQPTRARLYLTAHGLVVPYVNGRRVSDEVLAPGWTSYEHRLRYRVHDVTDSIHAGRNVIGFELAEGWYRGRFGFDHGARGIYGTRIGVIAQLEMTFADGTREVLATDESWSCTYGPVTFTNLYDGEERDLSLDESDWCELAADMESWVPAVAADFETSALEPADSPPVRRTETVAPVVTESLRPGVQRYDFGQNLVGRMRIRVDGPDGATVTMRHAEVLEGSELGVRPLRLARATDRLTLSGGFVEWEPEFTYHGFRYAEIACSDDRVRVSGVEAVVIHSDMRRTGWLETSDPLINRLFENSVWSLRGNFVDLPTDCPQRDERLGWTGDINVFAPTAVLLYDVAGVLRSWLRDLSAEQLAHESNVPPMFVPSIITEPHLAAVWGDATVGVPWALYEQYGDPAQLRESYPGVKAWIELVRTRLSARGVWDTDAQLGDWLDPTAPPDAPHAGRTDANLVATAYFIRSTRLASRIAALIGEPDDSERFADLAESVRSAFIAEYVSASGRVVSDSQAAYALALVFDLLDDDVQRERAGERLRDLVRRGGHRVGTGFVGTALILDALVAAGHSADAWAMLTETRPPSFLYPVTMGATTAWERWDSMLPDGRINPGEMTSFNHYALGAVAGWMQRSIGGIQVTEPGGRTVRIAPVVGGGVMWVTSRQETDYGSVYTSWRVEDGRFRLEGSVPVGVRGSVVMPDGSRHEVSSGNFAFSCAAPVPNDDPSAQPRGRDRMVIRSYYP